MPGNLKTLNINLTCLFVIKTIATFLNKLRKVSRLVEFQSIIFKPDSRYPLLIDYVFFK